MDADIVARMRLEEAELERKLAAVRAFLLAYPDNTMNARPPVRALAGHAAGEPIKVNGHRSSKRERIPLERYSDYGASVVRAAISAIKVAPSVPVRTSHLVGMIEATGVEIRGEDKANSLSALLARSLDLNSNGRKGWSLVEADARYGGHAPEENEAPTGNAGGASDAGDEGGRTPFDPFSNPFPSGSTS